MPPWPKPPKRAPKARKGLTRTRFRNGAASQKRGRASFPKVKNRAFRRWIASLPCLLAGRVIRRRFSEYDRLIAGGLTGGLAGGLFEHRCWGDMTPAHVGEHQARGAPDVGRCVPLCKIAHQEYDEHRSRWYQVTGFTEKRMANEAGGYALRYAETGGA